MTRGTTMGSDFSPTQIEAIELFAIGELTCAQVADQLNVSPTTITNWRRNRFFMESVSSRAREILKDSLPNIYSASIKKAKTGDSKHTKILLDHLDNIERTKIEKNHAQITFTWDICDNSNSVQTSPISDPIPSGQC